MAKPISCWEDTPAILYKYRRFDDKGQNLKALQEGELSFPSSKHFNDPFDCSLHYDLTGLESDLAFRWAVGFIGKEFPGLPLDQRKMLAKRRLEEIRSDSRHAKWFRDYTIRSNQDKFGICSLTPHARNLLMWAHYADNHRGFCVGFNMLTVVPFQNNRAQAGDLIDLYKVEYVEVMPKINFFKSMMSGAEGDDALTLLTTKSNEWQYETEYRLIRWDNADSRISVGRKGVAVVLLGCRVSTDNRDRVLAVSREAKPVTPVFQAHQEDFKFALRFQRIL